MIGILLVLNIVIPQKGVNLFVISIASIALDRTMKLFLQKNCLISLSEYFILNIFLNSIRNCLGSFFDQIYLFLWQLFQQFRIKWLHIFQFAVKEVFLVFYHLNSYSWLDLQIENIYLLIRKQYSITILNAPKLVALLLVFVLSVSYADDFKDG